MTFVNVRLYYHTQWKNPLLHCCTPGAKKESAAPQCSHSNWEDFTFQTPSAARLREFQVCEFQTTDDVEFVICSNKKDAWDNPPTHSDGNKNYRLEISNLPKSYKSPPLIDTDVPVVGIPSPFTQSTSPSRLSARIAKRPSEDCMTVVATLVAGELTIIDGNTMPPVMLITDLDGTFIGNDDAMRQLRLSWLRRHVLRGSHLVYNTGRNLKDFMRAVVHNDLPCPSFAILGVGTEIYDFPGYSDPSHSLKSAIPSDTFVDDTGRPIVASEQDTDICFPSWCPTREHARFLPDYLELMSKSFDRKAVIKLVKEVLPHAIVNGNIYHDPWRLSVLVDVEDLATFSQSNTSNSNSNTAMEELTNTFSDFTLVVCGHGEKRYVDIMPPYGGKLGATLYLMNAVGFEPSDTIVCGDSGNDSHMFSHPEIRGICVANAQPELVNFLKHVPDIFKGMERKKSNIILPQETAIPEAAGIKSGYFIKNPKANAVDSNDSPATSNSETPAKDSPKSSSATATAATLASLNAGKAELEKLSISKKNTHQKYTQKRLSKSEVQDTVKTFAGADFALLALLQGFFPTTHVCFATKDCAAGILEGLQQFGYA